MLVAFVVLSYLVFAAVCGAALLFVILLASASAGLRLSDRLFGLIFGVVTVYALVAFLVGRHILDLTIGIGFGMPMALYLVMEFVVSALVASAAGFQARWSSRSRFCSACQWSPSIPRFARPRPPEVALST